MTEQPLPLPDDVNMDLLNDPRTVFGVMAADTFKKFVIAVKSGDANTVSETMNTYVRGFAGTQQNPLQHLSRVAILNNSLLFRLLSGESNESIAKPPPRDISDVMNELPVLNGNKNLPHQELAVEMIIHAANHKYGEIERTMGKKVNSADFTEIQAHDFLLQFVATLVTMFIDLEGPKVFRWMPS